MRQWLAPEDVCLDIGAHAGAWAYPISRFVSHVYAFEAFPYYAQILRATLKVVGANNVTVLNNAVSARRGTVSIVWRAADGQRLKGFTHVAGDQEDRQGTVGVESLSLDEFIKERSLIGRRIALLKCDVEGYECEVLSGAADLIRRCRPVIYAEAQNSSFARYRKTSSDLIQLMTAHNYVANVFSDNGSTIRVDTAAYSGEGDILFCPTSLGLDQALS
jgi:FkbM family methyltransferase